MESILIILRKRLIVLILIAGAATISLSPLASNILFPNSGDFINHFSSIVQAKMALQENQFPLRVLPFSENIWGYALYQFYSPSAYLISGLIYQWIVPSNPYIALKLTLWLAIFIGGVFMYRLTATLVNSKYAALLASIAYITSPYFLIVTIHLIGFTEGVALGVIPAVLYYSMQLYYFPSLKFFLLMALSWYLLITIHSITFFYTSIFAALLLIMMSLQTRKGWRNLINVGMGYLFGLILSMWFLIPVAEMKNYLVLSSDFERIVDRYNVHLVSLFSPVASIKKVSLLSGHQIEIIDCIHPNIGLVFLLGIGVGLYAILNRRKINSLADNLLMPLLILFFCIVVLMWSPFHIWNLMPDIFTIGQYNWRLMGQMIWIASIVFAWSIAWLFPQERLNYKKVLIGLFFIIFSSSTWYYASQMPFTYADLPGMVKEPLMGLNPDAYFIDPGRIPGHIANIQTTLDVEKTKTYCHKKKGITECLIPASSEKKMIQLPVLYYPSLLNITLNRKKVDYQSELYKDSLIAAVESEPNIPNDVVIQFRGLQSANIISAIGWIVWVLLLMVVMARHFFKNKFTLNLFARNTL